MKIDLQAHAFHALSLGAAGPFREFTPATKARKGEVVGVARDVRLEGGEILELPSQGVYGRTPDGISRYPIGEVGPRWADQVRAAAIWAREDPGALRLVQTAGRAFGDRIIEVIHLRDVVVLTVLRTPGDLTAPGVLPLAEAVQRGTLVVLPSGLALTSEIHALGGAAHVLGERLWRIARGLPPGPLREACRRARVVVLPAESGTNARQPGRRAAS